VIPEVTKKQNNNNRCCTKETGMFRKLGLTIVYTLCLTLPSYALPSQNLTNLMEWTKNHPILRNLRPYPFPCTDFNTEAKEYTSDYWFARSVQLGFRAVVLVSNNSVINESIVVVSSLNTGRKLPVEKPNDREGILLIKSIYGQAVADDFNFSVRTEINQEKKFQVYRGRLFGYVITESFKGSFFVIPLNQFDANISKLRSRGALYRCADAE
jgi:hypothetical protein